MLKGKLLLRDEGRSKREEVVVLSGNGEWDGQSRIDSVSPRAGSYGVRVGHSVSQASALCSRLQVRVLSKQRLESHLDRLSEVALGFGTPVAYELPDLIWVDITGSSHLFGGEKFLGEELLGRYRNLGYSAQGAVANGPWSAGALARHTKLGHVDCVEPADVFGQVGRLPVTSLPISPAAAQWLARLGLWEIASLRKLPHSGLAERLREEEDPGRLMQLIQGHEVSCLSSHPPEQAPTEEESWEYPVSRVAQLLQFLQSAALRLSERLLARGEAAQRLTLTLRCDAAIARHRGERLIEQIVVLLPAALAHVDELLEVLHVRLASHGLKVPVVGLELCATQVSVARKPQLSLVENSEWSEPRLNPRSLMKLVSQLTQSLGENRVGWLQMLECQFLEGKSQLVPLTAFSTSKAEVDKPRSSQEFWDSGRSLVPTQLFSPPVRLVRHWTEDGDQRGRCGRVASKRWETGALLQAGEHLYEVLSSRFISRVETVAWWKPVHHACRDYSMLELMLWGEDRTVCLKALAYWDRLEQRAYLQAIFD